jgi:GT2 family glycosyltransferase
MLSPVSLIWLNYNSMHLIEVTKNSVNAILQIDYDNLEVILIDNHSTDGSAEVIERYVLENKKDSQNVKFVKLEKNFGPSGAMNIGNSIRNSSARYLAYTHNDLIPKSDYLKNTVTFLENHKEVGVVQGIVVKLGDESVVDSYGFMMNEALGTYAAYSGPVEKVCKPAYVTFIEGSIPVFNLNAIKSTLGNNELYVTAGFMYYLEDAFVSLKLWANGFKCMVLPVIVGAHYRMGTSNKVAKKQALFHYFLRNRIALLYMTNSASKLGFITQNIRKLFVSKRTVAQRKAILVSLIEGFRLGRHLRQKYGAIDLYSAPLIREPLKSRLFHWLH